MNGSMFGLSDDEARGMVWVDETAVMEGGPEDDISVGDGLVI